MKFDIVIGNPPYNNDIYLDFVSLNMGLSSKAVCMIMPTKHYFLRKPEYYGEINILHDNDKFTITIMFFEAS